MITTIQEDIEAENMHSAVSTNRKTVSKTHQGKENEVQTVNIGMNLFKQPIKSPARSPNRYFNPNAKEQMQ